MRRPDVISEYADLLADKLGFDQTLSRAVRQEVEDHLWEAVATDPSGPTCEAERRAIENFGDPDVIAAQFAVVSLDRQTRKVGVAIILVTAAVFLAMKARIAWYVQTQWSLSADMRVASANIGLIDSCAFWLSVVVALIGLAYLASCRIRAASYASYRQRLRRFSFLCALAATGLIVSVVCDGVLTLARLSETQASARFLIPVASMAFEIICAGALVFQIRCAMQRTTSAGALLTRAAPLGR
jgi:hypothetical protein